MENTHIKNRLLTLLRTEGLSQNDLAKQSGINKSLISRYVKGEIDPSSRNLMKLAEATKVSPIWLLGIGPDEPIRRI